ncbi:glycosyltransferase family 4 protein [Clostridium perfringens]|nr:glycosyltransferase family 4 protein [Clostridium perfringens]
MLKRKKILIINGQYVPGYKGGGPIQSCVNMIENLSDKFDFYVLTADRDYKSSRRYSNVKINNWNQIGSAKVFYMSPDKQTIKGFNEFFKNIHFDIIYLNGFFSPIFTIKPLILKYLGKLKCEKIILTPRGDFTGGCENKKFKKYGYIFLCRTIGFYDGLFWHATSELEKKDIEKKFRKADIFTIPNFSAKYNTKKLNLEKASGQLKLVFISRIFPKKNLKFALEVLKLIKEGNIIFDIYGPMEDKEYWSECEKIINEMPPNIKIKYCGEIEHSDVPKVFQQYHAFFFPTLGENYGHVIVEAMMNNCLCILSKGVTPWDEYIEKLNIGARLDENSEKFVLIIKRLLNMNNDDFKKAIKDNCIYISKQTNSEELILDYENMFIK